MALRATKPGTVESRLKLLLYGPAGSGKTVSASQFPDAYFIDCERGTENYADLLNKSNSMVFSSTDSSEIIAEIRALQSEKHDYRTLVIDPITTMYNDLLDKSEKMVGEDFGRHYAEAGKVMKRLTNMIMTLDMNVIVTAHAKTEYGDNLKKLGITFDGWKSLDYLFDLVIELDRSKGKRNAPRLATIVKTRMAAFADGDVFEWSYAAVRDRFGSATLERKAHTIPLATDEQVKRLTQGIFDAAIADDVTDKWLAKAGVMDWSDMPAVTIEKCIQFVESKLPE